MSTAERPRLTGLVVAGGAGRRYGSAPGDEGGKLAAPLGRRRVVDGALAAARAVADRVLLAGPPGLLDPGASGGRAGEIELLDDAAVRGPAAASQAGRSGPLAAIVAGLEAATTPLLAVVAGDLPFARSDVLADLAAAWCGEVAVVPLDGGVAQPLHAVWAVGHVAAVRAAFDAGERSPSRLLVRLGAAVVTVDAAGWADDVDTRADLLAARRRMDG